MELFGLTFSALLVFLCAWRSVSAEIPRPLGVEDSNKNYVMSDFGRLDARGVLDIFTKRQNNCYSPNTYCALYNKCCSSQAQGCCPDECTLDYPNECCAAGGYCQTGKECCHYGCMPTGSQCCKDHGYCPSPFICVIYDGVLGCCTDLSCTVYLSSSQTVTATATTRYVSPPASSAQITSAPARQTTTNIEVSYSTYYATLYWYYWYYFYTIYYSPSTYTTRTITTVTQTSYVTVSATDTFEASSQFLSISSDLPTPTDANVSIPPSPTSGAIITGQCSSLTTSYFIDTNGSPGSTLAEACQTITAGTGAQASTARTNSGSSQTSSGSSSSGQASVASHTLSQPWLELVLLSVISGTFVLAVFL